MIDEYGLTPDNIFNVDETNVTVNPKGQSKILTLKSRSQVGVLNPVEKKVTVTTERFFSASETLMPPLLIFHRK